MDALKLKYEGQEGVFVGFEKDATLGWDDLHDVMTRYFIQKSCKGKINHLYVRNLVLPRSKFAMFLLKKMGKIVQANLYAFAIGGLKYVKMHREGAKAPALYLDVLCSHHHRGSEMLKNVEKYAIEQGYSGMVLYAAMPQSSVRDQYDNFARFNLGSPLITFYERHGFKRSVYLCGDSTERELRRNFMYKEKDGFIMTKCFLPTVDGALRTRLTSAGQGVFLN